MEGPLSSLTYKGSISSAIVEAQNQKKLILVYISGEDEDSIHLEQSTWVHHTVAEPISKYCIFLHLLHGSVGASQFSAIYPQKSVPSISAVGYNGIMLWQHEGYIIAESFVESVEKAWAALHVQKTAVTLLSAALASRKPEPLSSNSPIVAPLERGSSSTLDLATTSADKPTQSSEDGSSREPTPATEQQFNKPQNDLKETRPGEGTSSLSVPVSAVEANREDQKTSSSTSSGKIVASGTRDIQVSATCNVVAGSTTPEENPTLDNSQEMVSPKSVGMMTVSGPESSQRTVTEVEDKDQTEKICELTESNAMKSNDVHLNIRLPNGASLQSKFAITDTLRLVKNYIDENQTNGMGSYDLATPYPRKVFNEQEMNLTLAELGFASRQALIVVPHRQVSQAPRGGSSQLSRGSQYVASGVDITNTDGGYFGFLKRMLSYVNPFSYLGGNASADSAPASGSNSSQQNHLPRPESSRQPYFQNHSDVDHAGNTRTTRPFGSNIHTLRHDEDDFPSGDRNTFWNGNSTQYGGDDK